MNMRNEMRLVRLYESPEQVETAFYEAFGNGDFVLMESLYADHGVSCTHPDSSTIIGRQNVIDNWEFVLEGIPQTVIHREILSISRGQGVEVHQVVETFDIEGAVGKKSEVFTTNVYTLQENGWRIQMQHSSLSKVKAPSPQISAKEAKFVIPQASMAIN